MIRKKRVESKSRVIKRKSKRNVKRKPKASRKKKAIKRKVKTPIKRKVNKQSTSKSAVIRKVLILGGKGFVGSAICNILKGCTIYTFGRSGGGKNHINGSITNLDEIKDAAKGMDCVVNLVGLTPVKKTDVRLYKKVHVDGVKNVIKACKANGVKRLVHMSALSANPHSPLGFYKTKGLGEKLVLNSGLNTTVFCPSVIYDKDNELIKLLAQASVTRLFPNIPARLQPVYRRDVAKLFVLAIKGKLKERRVEVGGPDVMTLFEIASKVYNSKGCSCNPIPLMLFEVALEAAHELNLFGIGVDQLVSMYIDNTTLSEKAKKYVKLTSFDDWLKKAKL